MERGVPPPAAIASPLIATLFEEARKAATAATSSASTIRPIRWLRLVTTSSCRKRPRGSHRHAICKHHRRPESQARAGCNPVHDGGHVIAACVKPWHRLALAIDYLSVFVGGQP